jgi:hypothetical protein
LDCTVLQFCVPIKKQNFAYGRACGVGFSADKLKK